MNQTITIPVPEGKKAIQTTDKDGNIIIKWEDAEPIRSKSWEEYVKNHPFTEEHTEFYIDGCAIKKTVHADAPRVELLHSGHMETKADAEAILALIKLKRLRDEWRNGWEPDWSNETQLKYCVSYKRNALCITAFHVGCEFLAFPDESMAENFKHHHNDLINQARPFLQ